MMDVSFLSGRFGAFVSPIFSRDVRVSLLSSSPKVVFVPLPSAVRLVMVFLRESMILSLSVVSFWLMIEPALSMYSLLNSSISAYSYLILDSCSLKFISFPCGLAIDRTDSAILAFFISEFSN